MKTLTTLSQKLMFVILATFSSVLAFAQDKGIKVDIDVDKGGAGDWYKQTWVWVVGGAVFILILVALLRGGKKN